MRVAMFSAQNYERALLDELNASHGHDLVYLDTLLGPKTALLAAGFPAVSVFVNDTVDRTVLEDLARGERRSSRRDVRDSIISTWRQQTNSEYKSSA